MRLTLILVAIGFLSNFALGQALFKFKGKSYEFKDLPKSTQQKLYELMNQNHKTKGIFLDDYILDMYVKEVSAKQKKSEKEIRKNIFKAKDPSEKELKAFYDENKDFIPYPFETIKSKLVERLKRNKAFEKRDEIVAKIKKDNKFQNLMTPPKPPVFSIDTTGLPMKGSSSAKVTIVEFADYQCPHCGKFYKTMKKLIPKYKSKVKFYFADFPVNASGISKHVAQGAYCAGKQKKYWEFHGMAFENQKSLSKKSSLEFAKKLKLNEKSFSACVKAKSTNDFIEKSKEQGIKVAVSGTPGVYINGKKVITGLDAKSFEKAIRKSIN